MTKFNKFQEQAISNIEKYYDGYLVIKYNLNPIKIKNGKINWKYQSDNNSRTYQLYLHSLQFIRDLKVVGSLLKEESYFKEARDKIIDWYESDETDTLKWNEHAVSSRIIHLIDFQEADHSYKLDDDLFKKIVIEHCDFLNDENNYKRNNHGLMMDNALIYASATLADKKTKNIFLEKALYRIRFGLYRDFSRKGVHLENSPEYHRVVLILYNKLKKSLSRHDLQLDKDIILMLDNARNYSKYLIKPNSTYPLLGDTGLATSNTQEKIYEDFVDYEAGIVIINNRDNDDEKNSAYLTFKAGYQSQTHKHYDDLSITYYNFGHDILIDSGKYSYNKADPIRNSIISPDGHSMISLKDELYPLTEPLEDQENLKLTKYMKRDGYKVIAGVNNLYPSVSIQRHAILTENDLLIIVDDILPASGKTAIQNFNINPKAIIKKIDESSYQIDIEENTYVLESFPVSNTRLSTSILENYYSEKFSQVTNNQRIIFEATGNEIKIVTVLYKKSDSIITDVIFENYELLLNINSEIVRFAF